MNMKEMIVGIDGINVIQLVVTGRKEDVEVAEKREERALADTEPDLLIGIFREGVHDVLHKSLSGRELRGYKHLGAT
jgi:hypothetical protein